MDKIANRSNKTVVAISNNAEELYNKSNYIYRKLFLKVRNIDMTVY